MNLSGLVPQHPDDLQMSHSCLSRAAKAPSPVPRQTWDTLRAIKPLRARSCGNLLRKSHFPYSKALLEQSWKNIRHHTTYSEEPSPRKDLAFKNATQTAPQPTGEKDQSMTRLDDLPSNKVSHFPPQALQDPRQSHVLGILSTGGLRFSSRALQRAAGRHRCRSGAAPAPPRHRAHSPCQLGDGSASSSSTGRTITPCTRAELRGEETRESRGPLHRPP